MAAKSLLFKVLLPLLLYTHHHNESGLRIKEREIELALE